MLTTPRQAGDCVEQNGKCHDSEDSRCQCNCCRGKVTAHWTARHETLSYIRAVVLGHRKSS